MFSILLQPPLSSPPRYHTLLLLAAPFPRPSLHIQKLCFKFSFIPLKSPQIRTLVKKELRRVFGTRTQNLSCSYSPRVATVTENKKTPKFCLKLRIFAIFLLTEEGKGVELRIGKWPLVTTFVPPLVLSVLSPLLCNLERTAIWCT